MDQDIAIFYPKTRSVCDSPLPKDATVDTHGSAFFNRTSIGTVESFHIQYPEVYLSR